MAKLLITRAKYSVKSAGYHGQVNLMTGSQDWGSKVATKSVLKASRIAPNMEIKMPNNTQNPKRNGGLG